MPATRATGCAAVDPAWLIVAAGRPRRRVRLASPALVAASSGRRRMRCPRAASMPPLAVAYFANAVLPARARRGCPHARSSRGARGSRLALVGRRRSSSSACSTLPRLLTIGLVGGSYARCDRPDRLDRDRVHDRPRRRPCAGRPFRGHDRATPPAPAPGPRCAMLAAPVPLEPFGRVGARTSLLAYVLSMLAWAWGRRGCAGSVAHALGIEPQSRGGRSRSPSVAALGTALPSASGYLGTYELGAVAIGHPGRGAV